MAQQGSSNADLFRAFARELIPQGVSGNLIIRGAQDAGFGIRRGEALNIIRDERQSLIDEAARPGTLGELPGLPGMPDVKWGELTQQTDEWLRFDGPNATMFQATGANPGEWGDFMIPPDDLNLIGYRFVIDASDDPNYPRGFATTDSFDPDIPIDDALESLGLEWGDVSRVIYDHE